MTFTQGMLLVAAIAAAGGGVAVWYSWREIKSLSRPSSEPTPAAQIASEPKEVGKVAKKSAKKSTGARSK